MMDIKDTIDNDDNNQQNPIPANEFKENQCTDIIWMFIYICFVFYMIFASAYGFYYGDLERVTNGYDCFGNVCGRKWNPIHLPRNNNSGVSTEGKHLLFQTYLTYWPWSRALCVHMCPSEDIRSYEHLTDYTMRTGDRLCNYDVNPQEYGTVNRATLVNRSYWIVARLPCPQLPIVPTQPLKEYCIEKDMLSPSRPTKSDYTKTNQISGINRVQPTADRLMRDLFRVWKELIILVISACVLSCIFGFLSRFATRTYHWINFVLVLVSSGVLVALLWICFFYEQSLLDFQSSEKVGFLQEEVDTEAWFLVYAIVMSILLIFLWISLVLLFSRLRLGPVVLEEVWNVVRDLRSLILQPFLSLLVLLLVFTWWTLALGYIMSMAVPLHLTFTGCIQFETWSMVWFFTALHVFGFFWIAEFILAAQQMITAGVVTEWYFAPLGGSSSCPLMSWMCHVVTKRLGSLALSSLTSHLLRIPQSLALALESTGIRHRMRSWRTEDKADGGIPDDVASQCAGVCSLCFLKYCCYTCGGCCCLGPGCRFSTSLAFPSSALHNLNFFSSGRQSCSLLDANAGSSTNDTPNLGGIKVSHDFLSLLTRLTIVSLMTSASILIFMSRNDLYFYAVPVFVVAIFTFYVSSLFTTLLDSVLDSLLICYVQDRRDESQSRHDSLHTALSRCQVLLNGGVTSKYAMVDASK